MNKSMLIGSVLGAVAVTAGGAYATYSLLGGPAMQKWWLLKRLKKL